MKQNAHQANTSPLMNPGFLENKKKLRPLEASEGSMTDALDSVDYQPEQMPHLTECLYCPGVRVWEGSGSLCPVATD